MQFILLCKKKFLLTILQINAEKLTLEFQTNKIPKQGEHFTMCVAPTCIYI